MGGRGGAGGSGKINSEALKQNLPYVSMQKLPQLEGSEKQVAWARSIRKEFLSEALREIQRYLGSGSAIVTNEAMMRESIDGIIAQAQKQNSSQAERASQWVTQTKEKWEHYQAVYSKLNETSQNKSAKWWIDNRTKGQYMAQQWLMQYWDATKRKYWTRER